MSRNEPARSRRRQLLKEQLSLRSIPLVEPPKEKYNLENHFGWKVLQKCRIGDGSFPPYLLHCIYCGKPDVPSREDGDHDKVMYVLYIRGKDGDLEPVDVKETQTAFSITNAISSILQSAPPPTPVVQKGKSMKRAPAKNRRIIGDFYYIPIKERIDMRYDIKPHGDDGDVADMGKGKGKKAERGRSKPKSWQLRAGAEYPEEHDGVGYTTDTDDSSEGGSENEEEEERVSRFIDSLKKYDCSDCFTRWTNDVELMESPLEKNNYLYLPKERYEKRSYNISDQETGNNVSHNISDQESGNNGSHNTSDQESGNNGSHNTSDQENGNDE